VTVPKTVKVMWHLVGFYSSVSLFRTLPWYSLLRFRFKHITNTYLLIYVL